MDVGLDGLEARAGLVEPLNRLRGRCTDLAEIRGLRLKLPEGFLMKNPKRQCFSIERLLDRAHSLGDVGGARALRDAVGLLPLMEREAEPIQLRLESRQALIQIGIVLTHREPVVG